MEQDTSPAQISRYHQLLRAMTPAQKVAATSSLCNAVRTAAIASLRHRHQGISDAELRIRYSVRVYGRAQAIRLFGQIPSDAV